VSDGATGERHRFRFFVGVVGQPGAVLDLEPVDVQHVRVLRLGAGDPVDVVDASGATWDARIVGAAAVELVTLREAGGREATIELVAGVLVGGRFDELVDGAVQAGATRIVPFAASAKDASRIEARRERLERIIRAAAKQAQRSVVPELAAPIDAAGLRAGPPGIVVDPGAPQRLADVVAGESAARLLVGASDGLPAAFVLELVERGWRRGRIGPSILRSELAAPVAVGIAAMMAS